MDPVPGLIAHVHPARVAKGNAVGDAEEIGSPPLGDHLISLGALVEDKRPHHPRPRIHREDGSVGSHREMEGIGEDRSPGADRSPPLHELAVGGEPGDPFPAVFVLGIREIDVAVRPHRHPGGEEGLGEPLVHVVFVPLAPLPEHLAGPVEQLHPVVDLVGDVEGVRVPHGQAGRGPVLAGAGPGFSPLVHENRFGLGRHGDLDGEGNRGAGGAEGELSLVEPGARGRVVDDLEAEGLRGTGGKHEVGVASLGEQHDPGRVRGGGLHRHRNLPGQGRGSPGGVDDHQAMHGDRHVDGVRRIAGKGENRAEVEARGLDHATGILG